MSLPSSTLISVPPYQPAWRNSRVMAPRGRNLSTGTIHFGHRPSYSATVSKQQTTAVHQHEQPTERNIMDNLQELALQDIDRPDVDEKSENVEISGCHCIGSYNWMNRDTPTIIVPGSPPIWSNRSPPYNVPPDIGFHFVDQAKYRMPKYPLLPLIMAVNKVSEGSGKIPTDWSQLDFVTDRNNLRKLLRWAGGDTNHDFRIDLQLAGKNTVIMSRWEPKDREEFSGRTFGLNFVKSSTHIAPGCKDSCGHHRIVKYDLNGLSMVVRFSVDACLPPPVRFSRRSTGNIDELMRSFNAVTLSPSLSTSRSEPRITILEGGSEIPPNTLMEICTRSEVNLKKNGFDWTEALPQLWFSQIIHHTLAVHQRGRFISIERRKIPQSAASNEQGRLKKLRKVLGLIQEVVREYGKEERLTLVCVGGSLRLYRRTTRELCLPESALKLFESS